MKLAHKFHVLSVESLVGLIHKAVEKRLWRLVMVEAELPKHLSAVRDLVLMRRGELWHEIITHSRSMMRVRAYYL